MVIRVSFLNNSSPVELGWSASEIGHLIRLFLDVRRKSQGGWVGKDTWMS